MSIQTELNARGLEGGDLESMIDYFLIVHAEKLANTKERLGGSFDEWVDLNYGHDAARFVWAMAAIGAEKMSEL